MGADKLSPLEQALRALPLDKYQETLELIQKLTQNVVRNPTEEKFRRIKLTNPKIAANITDVPNAVALLTEMGWVQEGEELVLPAALRLTHETHNVGIIDAKDWYKKEAEKEPLMKQMEADRKEKMAEGPVTKSSVAQKLGDGPNIMRAKDVGIGQSKGGG